jgi:uncharacterized membrane protein YbaN (DUF454 family)
MFTPGNHVDQVKFSFKLPHLTKYYFIAAGSCIIGPTLSPTMKLLFNIIGVLAVLLGILGLFLPLLPTTPFLLLASGCFARGSDRLHGWLLNHRVFGVYLRNFEAGNGIPLRAKIVASVMMWSSLLVAIVRFEHLGLRLALVLIGASVSLYLWRYLPTLRTSRN